MLIVQRSSFIVITVIFLPPPTMTKLHHSLCAHPTNFKTTKRKHLNKPKPLILVCCSDGEILQVHTKLDVYFIFSASKCQGNLHVSYFACVLRVASMEKTAVVSLSLSLPLSPPCPKCVKCLFLNLRLTFIF